MASSRSSVIGHPSQPADVGIPVGDSTAQTFVLPQRLSPLAVALGHEDFGAFDGLTTVLPGLFGWIPPELIRMIPFIVTILALLLFSYRAQRALLLRGAR